MIATIDRFGLFGWVLISLMPVYISALALSQGDISERMALGMIFFIPMFLLIRLIVRGLFVHTSTSLGWIWFLLIFKMVRPGGAGLYEKVKLFEEGGLIYKRLKNQAERIGELVERRDAAKERQHENPFRWYRASWLNRRVECQINLFYATRNVARTIDDRYPEDLIRVDASWKDFLET